MTKYTYRETRKKILYLLSTYVFYKLWHKYNIPFRSFGFLRRSFKKVKNNMDAFGTCDSKGNIRISIYKADNFSLVTNNQLIDTIAHEAAHLTHWEHNKDFWKLKKKYEKYMKGL